MTPLLMGVANGDPAARAPVHKSATQGLPRTIAPFKR